MHTVVEFCLDTEQTNPNQGTETRGQTPDLLGGCNTVSLYTNTN